MISIDIDRDMPNSCHECQFKYVDEHGGIRCPISRKYVRGVPTRHNDVTAYKTFRPLWCELRDNNKLSGRLHFKTQLSDGHVHLLAKDYQTIKTRNEIEKQRTHLRKLANNPALSENTKVITGKQVYYLNLLESYMRAFCEMRDKYEALKGKTGVKE